MQFTAGHHACPIARLFDRCCHSYYKPKKQFRNIIIEVGDVRQVVAGGLCLNRDIAPNIGHPLVVNIADNIRVEVLFEPLLYLRNK